MNIIIIIIIIIIIYLLISYCRMKINIYFYDTVF